MLSPERPDVAVPRAVLLQASMSACPLAPGTCGSTRSQKSLLAGRCPLKTGRVFASLCRSERRHPRARTSRSPAPSVGSSASPTPAANTLGTALYSSTSQIAIRLISPTQSRTSLPCSASACQRHCLPGVSGPRHADAYRLIFSEADLLPGKGLHRQWLNDVLAANSHPGHGRQSRTGHGHLHAHEHLQPASMAERTDPRVRELESLPRALPRCCTDKRARPRSP